MYDPYIERNSSYDYDVIADFLSFIQTQHLEAKHVSFLSLLRVEAGCM